MLNRVIIILHIQLVWRKIWQMMRWHTFWCFKSRTKIHVTSSVDKDINIICTSSLILSYIVYLSTPLWILGSIQFEYVVTRNNTCIYNWWFCRHWALDRSVFLRRFRGVLNWPKLERTFLSITMKIYTTSVTRLLHRFSYIHLLHSEKRTLSKGIESKNKKGASL